MKTEPTEALKEIKRCAWAAEDFNIRDGFESHEVIDEDDAINIANIAFREGQSSPKIKQLEWEDTDMWYFKAKTSLGLGYSITEIKGTYIVHFGDAPISWEKSLESAKAAAQRDFERRVMECLDL